MWGRECEGREEGCRAETKIWARAGANAAGGRGHTIDEGGGEGEGAKGMVPSLQVLIWGEGKGRGRGCHWFVRWFR